MANITEYIIRVIDRGSANIDRITNSTRRMNAELSNSISRIPVLGSALSSFATPATAVVAVVSALGLAYMKSAEKSLEWAASMAEVNVTAELTTASLRDLSTELRTIGGRNVAGMMEIPKAYGRIISAGLDVKTSLDALEPTLRAAKAGFTDIETTAAAGVSTMMASGENINRVYDVLFETVKEGNASFKDIAQYLPKIVPLARNAGFALDETAGAFASLTGKLSAEQSTTAMQGIMRSVSDPKITKAFENLGVQIFDKKTNAIRPMLDIIKDTEQKMSGLSDKARLAKFDSLGLDQMSTLGFSTLTQDVQGLEKAINATVNSQGALGKAYEDSLTPMDSWRVIQNKVTEKMLKLGDTALPIITKIGEKILGVINYFEDLYNKSLVFRDIIGLIGKSFSLFMDNFMAGFKILGKVLGGIGDAIKWITNDVLGLSLSFGSVGDFVTKMYITAKPYLLYIYELLSKISLIGWKISTLQWIDAKNLIDGFAMPNLLALQERVIKEAYGDNVFSNDVPLPKGYFQQQNNSNAKGTGVPPADAVKGTKNITAGGTRNTSVYVTVGKLQSAEVIYLKDSKEGKAEIEDNAVDALIRALSIATSTVR